MYFLYHHFRVSEYETENKMSAINLASIFGPVLMTVDQVRTASFEVIELGR